MSLKPPKKGDLEKSWMRPRRENRVCIQPEYHLIVTEGTNTEPAYFEEIKDEINRQYKGRIQLDISGEGDNTLGLLEKAIHIASESPNPYRHVWVVYDTDDFPSERIDQTEERCNSQTTDETEYHALWSNQCIELWFLLHFSYMHSDIHRSEYWPKLSASLASLGYGDYRKNRQDMYSILKPNIDNAIRNAKKLAQTNKGKAPSLSAPGTRVFELVEKLKPYLR